MRIAVIGLGHMGSGIAANLLKAGHTLTVFNRTHDKARPLEQQGATVAITARGACTGAEVLITMLADDEAIEALVLDENDGAIAGLAAGAVHIAMDTISPPMSQRLAAEHARRDQHYLAAPVFGRPETAVAAQLSVVVAGPKVIIERCRPLFDVIGRQCFVVGERPESANIVKLAGNFMIAAMIESLGEAFALCERSGIAAETFLHVLNDGLFHSPVYANYGKRIADSAFEPAGFTLALGHKDVRFVREAGEKVGVRLPIANVLNDRFASAEAKGLQALDWSAISRVTALPRRETNPRPNVAPPIETPPA